MFEVIKASGAAEKCGLREGDAIVSISGESLIDYIDYEYFCGQTRLSFRVLRGGKRITLRMKKGEDEDLGLEFKQPLLGSKRVCRNHCVFCFVDQLPRGMRKSLYVKDEDWRWSLLSGSYVTLTDLPGSEIRRIIKRGAGPLYISVHAVDEKLRRFMTGNDKALRIRPLLKKLARRGIAFHAQAVICPGLNDEERLEETIRFLVSLYPAARSLAVVPVGLTGHREGLYPLSPVTAEMAQDTIKRIEKWQKECLNSLGTRFVFASDEYYIKAGLPLPGAECYEAFGQIENGVGLLPKMLLDAKEALSECRGKGRQVSTVTGADAYPYILELSKLAHEACGADISVYRAENRTFGGGVTVSGLLGGADILRAVEGKPLGEALLIPENAVNEGRFLDDMTTEQLSEALHVPIAAVDNMTQWAKLICAQ